VAVPLLRRKRLEQREARRPDSVGYSQSFCDRQLVVKSLGPARLVVALDLRILVGHEASKSGIGHGLGVGEMVGNLACRPAAVRWSAIELLVGDAREGGVDGLAPRSKALEQGLAIGHRSSVHGS
jgi:hypothetical protein